MQKADLFKDMLVFAKDDRSLRSVLVRTDIFDWKQYFCLSIHLISFCCVIKVSYVQYAAVFVAHIINMVYLLTEL